MAIAFTTLTGGASTSNTTSYTTSSFQAAANNLVLVFLVGSIATTPFGTEPAVSLSGGSLSTWVEVDKVAFTTLASPQRTLRVFRGMSASPGASAALTITWNMTGAGAATLNGCAWSIFEFSGVDTTGTNGSGAIVQTKTNSTDSNVSTFSATFTSTMGASNAAAMALVNGNQENVTPRTSWTEVHDDPTSSYASPSVTIESQYILGTDTAASASWTTGSKAGILAVEVKASGGTNFTQTVGDTSGLTDNRTGSGFTADRTYGESLGGVDSRSQVAAFIQTQTQALGLTDQKLSTSGLTFTNSFGLVDAATQLQDISRPQTESIGLLDAKSSVLSRTLTESIGAADSPSDISTFIRSFVEAETLLDGQQVSLSSLGSRIFADLLSMADSRSQNVSHSRTITDHLGLLDSLTRSYSRVMSDNLGISDSRIQAFSLVLSILDHLGIADVVFPAFTTLFSDALSEGEATVSAVLQRTLGLEGLAEGSSSIDEAVMFLGTLIGIYPGSYGED